MDKQEIKYIRKRRRKAAISSIPYYICGLLPIKKNKIVFSAFEGKGYCCNPKYVAEEFIQRARLSKERYEMVWLVNDLSKEFPKEIKKVRNTLWNRAYHLSTAKVWVDNARKNWGTRKRKNQFYMQTWHGSLIFKPIGRRRGQLFSKIAELVSSNDAKLVDVLLSDSEWSSNNYKESFWGEPIALIGLPRSDILFRTNARRRELVRERFGIPKDAKIVLYAPTFRGGSQNTNREVFAEEFSLDFELLKQNLQTRFGGEWYVFVRLHPQLAHKSAVWGQNSELGIIDISKEDDLYELLAAMDAAVTDYSSVAFDAAFLRIPVFLYADDYDAYVKDRGELLWSEADNPFPMAMDNAELSQLIREFDMEKYREKLEGTFNKIGLLEDGKASERAVDIILSKMR